MTPHPQNWSKEVAPGLGNMVYWWLQDWETLFIGGASSRPQSHAPTMTTKTELQKNGLDKTMFSFVDSLVGLDKFRSKSKRASTAR